MKTLFIAGMLLLLAACASNPTQEAADLLSAYKAAATPALACVQQPACNEIAGDEIRATDKVAFGYTETVTNAAIAWAEAPEDQKPAKLSVFDRVLALGDAAVDTLSGLIDDGS